MYAAPAAGTAPALSCGDDTTAVSPEMATEVPNRSAALPSDAVSLNCDGAGEGDAAKTSPEATQRPTINATRVAREKRAAPNRRLMLRVSGRNRNETSLRLRDIGTQTQSPNLAQVGRVEKAGLAGDVRRAPVENDLATAEQACPVGCLQGQLGALLREEDPGPPH